MDGMKKIKTAYGAIVGQFTAGSTSDNQVVMSEVVDREDFYAASVCLGWTANISASNSLSALLTVEDSSDGATFSPLATVSTVLATETGSGTKDMDIDIMGAKRYLRVQSQLDLSAAATDTASYYVAYVLGDPSTKPV